MSEKTPLLVNNIQETPIVVNDGHVHNTEKKSSVPEAIFLLWTDIAGVGSLAIGYYMASGGVWFTIIMLTFVAFIADAVARWVYDLAYKYNQSNFIDMCDFALGTKGRVASCFFVFSYNFGGLCANLIALGKSVPPILTAIFGHSYWWANRHYVILFSCVILFPIGFFKNIASVAWTCILVIACYIAALVSVLYLGISNDKADHFVGFDDLSVIKPGFTTILGGLCYIFVCHDICFSIALSLKNPTKARWALVPHASIGFTFLLAIVIGIFNYGVFGVNTATFSFDNYGVHNNIANFGRLMIMGMIVMGIPFCVFMPRMALEGVVFAFVDRQKLTTRQSNFLHIALTLIIMFGALAVGEFVTDLGQVLEFLGGIAAAGISFVMPTWVLLKVIPGRWWHPKENMKFVFVLIFGLFCFILTIINTIQEIIK